MDQKVSVTELFLGSTLINVMNFDDVPVRQVRSHFNVAAVSITVQL